MAIRYTKPTRRYGAYIFDCDGTLVDSMPLHLRAWNAGLKAAGAPFKLDPKGFMSVAGMALVQTVDHWNRTHGTNIDPASVVEAKNWFFEEHRKEILEIREMTSWARELSAESVPCAVASGGTREDVLWTLEHLGLLDLFQVVVTADDVEVGKPAPDLFLLAAAKLRVAPEECLVIEDSKLGIQAADIAGMDSILLENDFTD